MEEVNKEAILKQIQIIAEVPLNGDTKYYVGHQTAAAVIDTLDRAGFVIVPKTGIRKALDDASGLDKWHKFGEGYVGLREFLERLAP